MLRAGKEVGDRLVLDCDSRILKAEKMFEGRLQRADKETTNRSVPVHGGHHQAVTQVEVSLPVDCVILIAPRHMPDRRARHSHGAVAMLTRAQPVIRVIPLDEKRQRLA